MNRYARQALDGRREVARGPPGFGGQSFSRPVGAHPVADLEMIGGVDRDASSAIAREETHLADDGAVIFRERR